MFKALRRRLTLLCTAGTALVLAGMAVAALQVSLGQLALQAEASFRSSVNGVLYHLGSQPVIDPVWLARTEAENGLWIRIQGEHSGLQYTGLSEERERLTARALELAEAHPLSSTGGSLPQPEPHTFDFRQEGHPYSACVTRLAGTESPIRVVVVKDNAAYRCARGRLILGFSLSVGGGGLLLFLFAWLFCGRALQPVEEAHRLQEEFLTAASHELRSPLAVVEMSAGTIRRNPHMARPLAEKIEGECARMARLLSDLLTLSRMDGGGWRSHLAETAPAAMLTALAERYRPLAEARGIRLNLTLPASLPPIRCDPLWMERILSAFLDNALRFTAGQVELSGEAQNGRVRLTVGDDGPGVPPAERERVFRRFYQSDAARGDREHFGMGLSIARELADLHGGITLTVEDSPLGGAAFRLELAAVPSPSREENTP